MADGNTEQTRIIAETVADATITRFVSQHPVTAEIPAPLKWLGAAAMAVVMLLFVGVSGWLVTSVDSMQDTLARMDERQMMSAENLSARFGVIDERLERLEGKREGAQ